MTVPSAKPFSMMINAEANALARLAVPPLRAFAVTLIALLFVSTEADPSPGVLGSAA